MKALRDFARKLSADFVLDADLIVEKAGRYFLLSRKLQGFIRRDFYYAGTYLGKVKNARFFPSFNLLAMLARGKANKISVETSQDMYEAVVSELKSRRYDIVLAVAAVSDWTPKKKYEYKVPTRTQAELTVKFKATPKIIDAVKKVSPDTFLVAFRAEYGLSDEDLIQSAYERLKKAKSDLIVANDIGRKEVGFRYDTNEVFIVDTDKKVVHVPVTTKRKVAKRLFDVIVDKIKQAR